MCELCAGLPLICVLVYACDLRLCFFVCAGDLGVVCSLRMMMMPSTFPLDT